MDNYVKDLIELRFLNEDREQLFKWYEYILQCDSSYVIFTNERIYKIFMILDYINGNKMNESDKKFLTTGAFLLRINELIENFKKEMNKSGQMEAMKSFPKILVCCDLIDECYEFNFLFPYIKEELKSIAKNKNAIDNSSVQILESHELFSTMSRPDNFREREYLFAYGPVRYMSTRFFSEKTKYRLDINRSMRMINAIFQINSIVNIPCYSFTENISDKEFERTDKDEFKEIVSLGNLHKEYIKVDFLGNGHEIQMIYTLSFKKNYEEKNKDVTYQVKPFVYLPDLSNEETKNLFNNIRKLGLSKGYDDNFFKKLESIYNMNQKRNFNEWISLILNQSIINDFNRKFCIKTSQEDKDEIIKNLSLNYNLGDDFDNIKYLEDIISNPIISSVNELKQVISNSLTSSYLINVGNRNISSDAIKDGIEKYFIEEKIKMHEGMGMIEGRAFNPDYNLLTNIGSFEKILKTLFCDLSIDNIEYAIAYMQSLINDGFISISNSQRSTKNVSGFSQYIFINEYTLLMLGKKYREFFDAVDFINIHAKDGTWKMSDVEKYLKIFKKYNPLNLSIDDLEYIIKMLTYIPPSYISGIAFACYADLSFVNKNINKMEAWELERKRQENSNKALTYFKKYYKYK